MKANELMIDDWVLWKDKPVQIARVSGVVYSFGHIDVTLAHCGNGVLETHDIKSISPIPLTPEILEKNGFKKCAGNEWSVFKYEDDDYTKKALYQVLWSADELYLEIGSYTLRTGEFNRMGVEFVHELQHALRLCGITCEIIL